MIDVAEMVPAGQHTTRNPHLVLLERFPGHQRQFLLHASSIIAVARAGQVLRWRKLVHGQEGTALVSRMNCLMHRAAF